MTFGFVLFILERLFWVGLAGTGVYLGVRHLRASERRSGAVEVNELRNQVQQLQETVDTLRSDLDRLQESQDFTTRLLSERSSKRE